MTQTQSFLEPVEEKNTRWHNPLPVEQKVDIHHGTDPRPTRYRWKPGETKEIPSRYDYAIQRVHNGAIIGGLAPQLVKVGSTDVLDEALDTEKQKKKGAEAEAARAALTRKAADDALISATAQAAEADGAIAAKAAKAAKVEAKTAAQAAEADGAIAAKAEEERPLPPEARRKA